MKKLFAFLLALCMAFALAGCGEDDYDDYKYNNNYNRYNNDYNNNDSGNNNAYESGYTALEITVDRIEHNSSYTVCTGSVKNNGKRTYSFVQVKGTFKGSDGNVLDTSWTYAVGAEGLAPGETTTFRMSVAKNSEIKSCSVSILEYK